MPLYFPPLQSAQQLRDNFIGDLLTITGDTRLLWLPKPTDTTTALDESLTGRTITWDATVAARLSAIGLGYAQSFASASSQYGTTPDTANLSFNTGGLTDLPFSLIALANVTDTAASRNVITKWNGAATVREWQFVVTSTDALELFLYDESVDKIPNRLSDAAITQGSFHLLGSSYDGTGGATAANGITLYQDGVVKASTPTNDASYVAMEDTSATLNIGAQNAGGALFMDGSIALALVCAGALTASQMWAAKKLVNSYFNLSL